jgi:hypothetical protein
MAPGDAATLLTALLIARASAASLNDITLLTKSHLQYLICQGDDDGRSWENSLTLPQLSRLKPNHTFGDAFIALIASISNGDMERSVKKWNKKTGQRGLANYFEIQVEINNLTPHQEAKIGFRTPIFLKSVLYLRRRDVVLYPPREWSDVHDLGDDLRVSATISESTLKTIGDLLGSPETVQKAIRRSGSGPADMAQRLRKGTTKATHAGPPFHAEAPPFTWLRRGTRL